MPMASSGGTPPRIRLRAPPPPIATNPRRRPQLFFHHRLTASDMVPLRPGIADERTIPLSGVPSADGAKRGHRAWR